MCVCVCVCVWPKMWQIMCRIGSSIHLLCTMDRADRVGEDIQSISGCLDRNRKNQTDQSTLPYLVAFL